MQRQITQFRREGLNMLAWRNRLWCCGCNMAQWWFVWFCGVKSWIGKKQWEEKTATKSSFTNTGEESENNYFQENYTSRNSFQKKIYKKNTQFFPQTHIHTQKWFQQRCHLQMLCLIIHWTKTQPPHQTLHGSNIHLTLNPQILPLKPHPLSHL